MRHHSHLPFPALEFCFLGPHPPPPNMELCKMKCSHHNPAYAISNPIWTFSQKYIFTLHGLCIILTCKGKEWRWCGWSLHPLDKFNAMTTLRVPSQRDFNIESYILVLIDTFSQTPFQHIICPITNIWPQPPLFLVKLNQVGKTKTIYCCQKFVVLTSYCPTNTWFLSRKKLRMRLIPKRVLFL